MSDQLLFNEAYNINTEYTINNMYNIYNNTIKIITTRINEIYITDLYTINEDEISESQFHLMTTYFDQFK